MAGKKILLAEDNELNMEIARFMLEDAGAEVVSAYDGREAINIYDESSEGAFDDDRKTSLAAGMDEHLTKPLDSHKLMETVLRLCS